jgi:PAS domain S-box-containing protein
MVVTPPSVSRLFAKAARVIAILVAGAGVCGLLGWMVDSQLLKGVFRGGVTIKANAAIGLILAATALGVLQEGARPLWRRIGRGCAVLAASLGGLTLVQHLTGFDFGIDQLLFNEAPGAIATTSPGRMGPPASLSLLLGGTALLLLDTNKRGRLISQGLGILIIAVTSVPLIGYAHNVDELYITSKYTGIALHTAIALWLFGVGIVLARPQAGLMATISAEDAGGLMARRLMLPVIALPFATGWLRWVGETSGVVDATLGRPLAILFLSFCGGLLILFNARGMSALDRQRAKSLRTERFLNQLHQQLVSLKCPKDILRTASEQVGRYLSADRCYFCDWPTDRDFVRVEADWHAGGMVDLTGIHRFSDYAPPAWRERWISGVTLSDVEVEPELQPFLANYRTSGIRALAVASFAQPKATAFLLVVTSCAPRLFTYEEISLLKIVIDRVWPLVERARSDEALSQSERRLRAVTDHAPVLLANFDRDHRYTFVNQSYARRFGRTVEETIGARASDILGPELYGEIQPHLTASLSGESVQVEQMIPDLALGPRSFHAIYTPEESPDGRIVGVFVVITDISVRKRFEREIENARDQALASSLAKDAFIAAISHELRTPLSPVLLIASEAAENAKLPADIRREFAVIRHHIELEARLIDDLLDLSRILHGKLALHREVVNGAVLLRDAIEIVRKEVEAKHLKLHFELPSEPQWLNADPVRLQQVFWNVLKNAVKFTPCEGWVRVRATASRETSQFIVTVEDSGLGMTEEELARAFEPFSQGEHAASAAHQFGGLGIGLAITRLLVTLHDGTISATSSGRGHGTKVAITLPLTARTAPIEPEPPDGGDAVDGAELVAAGAGARVLVVEDHDSTREALVSLLRRRNFRVLSAASKAEALTLASNGIDLLLSDVGLPDGDGCELMTELRRMKNLRGIAMTGYGMEADVARTRAAGFIAHLTKPVRIHALDAALSAAFERETAPEDDQA